MSQELTLTSAAGSNVTDKSWLGGEEYLTSGGGATATQVDCTTPHNFLFVLYTLIMGAVCTFGLAGNTVSLIVLQRDHTSPVASFLLQSLAVADNTLLITWMLNYSVRELARVARLDAYYEHPAWLYVRIYTFTITYMAQTATVWLTVVLALNRFIAVCLPYSSPRMCKLTYVRREVAAVAIFAIVYNAPRIFEIRIDKHNVTNKYNWVYTHLNRNPVYAFVYSDVLYYIITFALPLLILGVVNAKIIVAYRATVQRKRSMHGGGSSTSQTSSLASITTRSATENNVTLVMLIVVVIFMLCLAPARLVQIVTDYAYSACSDASYYLIHVSNSLEMLNSSVNFVIYVVYHKRFRHLFCDLCCCPRLASVLRCGCCSCCSGGRRARGSRSDPYAFSLLNGGRAKAEERCGGEGSPTARRLTGTTMVDGETRTGTIASTMTAHRYTALTAAHEGRANSELIALHSVLDPVTVTPCDSYVDFSSNGRVETKLAVLCTHSQRPRREQGKNNAVERSVSTSTTDRYCALSSECKQLLTADNGDSDHVKCGTCSDVRSSEIDAIDVTTTRNECQAFGGVYLGPAKE